MKVKHSRYGRWQYLICMIVLVACGTSTPDAPTSIPTPILQTLVPVDLPVSTWGEVELINQAEQTDAPIFTFTSVDRITTWAGAQNGQVTHFTEGITDTQHQLDLPTFFPQQQYLLPTAQGALKLWLDRNNSDFNLRIQASTLAFDGTLETGIIPVNNQRTRNYSVIALNQREFRIVWSGGLGDITNLYLHQIDDSGRPVGGDLLQIDGDHPAMVHDNDGIIHLFWLSNNGRDAFHATFDEIGAPSLINIRRIASHNLEVTDAVTHFNVAFDGTHAHLFWTVRQIDDTQHVWMSSGQLQDDRFQAPSILNVDETAIQWINSTSTTQNPLPIVANANDALYVLWFADGNLQSSELISNSGRLIGVPYIDTNETRIGVSWAQATTDGFANLFYVERSR